MTDEERKQMMEEIMQVVDKHVSMSEGKKLVNDNRYGREFGISDDSMMRWKKEYKKMRVEGFDGTLMKIGSRESFKIENVTVNRDINGARNILIRALRDTSAAV